jgi:hypothetical protein
LYFYQLEENENNAKISKIFAHTKKEQTNSSKKEFFAIFFSHTASPSA